VPKMTIPGLQPQPVPPAPAPPPAPSPQGQRNPFRGMGMGRGPMGLPGLHPLLARFLQNQRGPQMPPAPPPGHVTPGPAQPMPVPPLPPPHMPPGSPTASGSFGKNPYTS
jgi:hypothetical protein